ncbi:PCI domain-containing protein [Xylariaceae sp. FL0594]|nr:PCI domain-containing protein [Xylariaceae sp. FL0594]
MEQTKALNALAPFLALTKSATSARAAADLVTQATSNPNTYVFSELLETPQIQALAESPDYASHLKLLNIFSYGTYADYVSTPNLPPLSENQALKLRQLSLLSLAKSPHNLSYSALQKSLGLHDARAVEDLVISAIYAGLVDAQLDPHNNAVHISSVSPLRDLAPGSVPPMLQSLCLWSERCTSALEDLEAQIAAIKAESAKQRSEAKAWDQLQARLKETEESQNPHDFQHRQSAILNRALSQLQGHRSKRGSGSLEAGLYDDGTMDLDDDDVDDGEGGATTGSGGGALGGPGKKRANRRKL